MAKKIGKSDIIGDRGVAFIRQLILEIGFVFYETGGVEAGIDGYIEIRDPVTGVVSNQVLQFQSRATTRALPGDKGETFAWPITEDELAYWRNGTAPVVLIIVEPDARRAYWKFIKGYFDTPEKLTARKIVFHKTNDALTNESGPALAQVAESQTVGAIPLPNRVHETLTLNLLRVGRIAPTIYWAPTEYSTGTQFNAALREIDPKAGSEWIVRSNAVMSFHDLDQDPWRRLIDPGAIEPFDVDEWADADDPDRERQFVELLRRSLSQLVRPTVRFDREDGVYYFASQKGRDRVSVSYRASTNMTARAVVERYKRKKAPTETAFWRHSAFRPRWHRFDGDWYLEVTPTYYYTYNGNDKSRFTEDYLKKIKELEDNNAVIGQFLMWRHWLCERGRGDLVTPGYPFLGVEALDSFGLDRGVPDDLWRSSESNTRPTEASLFDVTT